MDLAFCPRCGADVRLPYCRDCGWNLDEVYRHSRKHDRSFAWMVCAFGVAICIPVIINDPRKGILALVIVLAFTLFVTFSTKYSKSTLGLNAMRVAVAKKPGTDLSSAVPDIMPARVVAYGEALRSIPRPRTVRLTGGARGTILMLRIIAGLFAAIALRFLAFPAQRVLKSSDALLFIGLLLFAAVLWFLAPIPLRKERRLDLLVNGEVILARVARAPQWWRGGRFTFEFQDTTGRLIRGEAACDEHAPVEGAYIPVFYNSLNPENCAPTFALNYAVVPPQGFGPSTDRAS